MAAMVHELQGAHISAGVWDSICAALGADGSTGLGVEHLRAHYAQGPAEAPHNDLCVSRPRRTRRAGYPRSLYAAPRPVPRRLQSVREKVPTRRQFCGCRTCGMVLWCKGCVLAGRRKHPAAVCRSFAALRTSPQFAQLCPAARSMALAAVAAATTLGDGGNDSWVHSLSRHVVGGAEGEMLQQAAEVAAASLDPRADAELCAALPAAELFNAFAVHAPERPARIRLVPKESGAADVASRAVVFPGAACPVAGVVSVAASPSVGTFCVTVATEGGVAFEGAAEELRYDPTLPSCEMLPLGVAVALPSPMDDVQFLAETLGGLVGVVEAAQARHNIPRDWEPLPPVASAVHGVAAMLNHGDSPTLRVDVLAGGGLSFRAMRSIAAGEPLDYCYVAGAGGEGAAADSVRQRFGFS
eukprot:TRINITY_DN21869_c0_g1_i1.p1 TRINITY_DN21869_c0_g1~~TRINITY_DN21869_c0_g1_i1.p1  ORF type:complete len:413 (+),score=106.73 TRINITY_DN21869_c0_g1_i1:301-1539(+)